MRKVSVGYFLEDSAHRNLIPPLMERLAADMGKQVEHRLFNSTGGAGRVMASYDQFASDIKRGAIGIRVHILVVALDGNCKGIAARRREILSISAKHSLPMEIVPAVPDPHIEKWYLSDPGLLHILWGGAVPGLPKEKCERGMYKDILSRAAAPIDPPFGGIEYGEEIAARMALQTSSERYSDLKDFLRNARLALQNC